MPTAEEGWPGPVAGSAERPPTMVDLAFDMAGEGEGLAPDYPRRLLAAVARRLAWFADERWAGIHPIKGPRVDAVVLVSRRAKLVLRLPQSHVEAARALSGARLDVGGATLVVGVGRVRALEPHPTLHARQVVLGADDEVMFHAALGGRLAALGVPARFVCGRCVSLATDHGALTGFSVALHGLSAAHSLLIQQQGLGEGRKLGCGIFVPHRVIAGLE